jgi:hypothetical protein
VDKNTKVICQGITGKNGTFHTEQVSEQQILLLLLLSSKSQRISTFLATPRAALLQNIRASQLSYLLRAVAGLHITGHRSNAVQLNHCACVADFQRPKSSRCANQHSAWKHT